MVYSFITREPIQKKKITFNNRSHHRYQHFSNFLSFSFLPSFSNKAWSIDLHEFLPFYDLSRITSHIHHHDSIVIRVASFEREQNYLGESRASISRVQPVPPLLEVRRDFISGIDGNFPNGSLKINRAAQRDLSAEGLNIALSPLAASPHRAISRCVVT